MKGHKRLKRKAARALLFIIALISAFAFIVPTLLTFTNSFMSQSELNAKYGVIFSSKGYMTEETRLKFIPDMASFKQYSSVLFKSPDYLMKFWNSMILTVPIVAFQLIIALLAAYSFTRFRGRLKELIFFVYIVLMLMPYQVTMVPNYLVADRLRLLDTRWAIWLPAFVAPFSVFLLTKSMRRIPKEMFEAGMLDGANDWKLFLKICVPMCKNVIYSVIILVFLDYWNMVEQPLILLSDEFLHPLSVYLARINSGEMSIAFAVATIYMIPCVLLFLYGEEYLVEGIIYAGSLKG